MTAQLRITVLGCGASPGVPRVGNDRLHLLNDTTVPVQLAVQGRVIAFVDPGASKEYGPSDLGPMPWRVAVLSNSGRPLLSLVVEPDSVHDDMNVDGTGSCSAPSAGLDLSCGQLLVYVGRMMPGGGVPGPGVPGDCDT